MFSLFICNRCVCVYLEAALLLGNSFIESTPGPAARPRQRRRKRDCEGRRITAVHQEGWLQHFEMELIILSTCSCTIRDSFYVILNVSESSLSNKWC